MERGLVVVDDTDSHRALLREAAEHAAGADAELVLLTLANEDELEQDVETLSSIGEVEDANYDAETVLSAIAGDTETMAEDVLAEFDVDFQSVAIVTDDDAETVLTTSEERDCDHVFLLGRRRSPTGKAMFGDVAQKVILNFDGYVTVSMA